jgi:hypothetical protein
MAPNQALERAVTTASQLHEAFVPVAQRRALWLSKKGYAQKILGGTINLWPCINKATLSTIEKDTRDLGPEMELSEYSGKLMLRMNIVRRESRSNDCAWHPLAYSARLFLTH